MRNEIGDAYLNGLNESDLEKILSLFTPAAVVVSPLYGEMSAIAFYKQLFSDTKKSETKLTNTMVSGDGAAIALHFNYIWTLSSGKVVEFDCVDVFELSADKRRFSKLTIVYDTYPIRAEHLNSQKMSACR